MTESFEIFPWQNNYSLGIPQIDEQHQKLVHLLNKLAIGLATQANNLELKNIFNELASYAAYHFQTEEHVWNQSFADDEWEKSHVMLHESFVAQVHKIQSQEGITSFRKEIENVLSFLTHWLIFHILDSDKRMAIVTLAMQSGMSIEQSKLRANREMSGAAQIMIETVLSMSDKLTSRTLQLIKEKMESQRLNAQQFLASKSMEIDLKAAGITERERDVMALVVAGYSSKEIAQQLDISRRTVEVHRAHIMQKTGSSNLFELARIHKH
jgi:hemerythrin-like metal-binding protein